MLIGGVALLAFGGLGLQAVRAQEELAEIQKKMAASWDKLKSYSANMKMSTSMPAGKGVYKMESEGKILIAKDGDKVRYRQELVSKQTQPGQNEPSKSTMLAVCDGDIIHVLTENAGQKMVMKQNVNAMPSPDPMTMIKTLQKTQELKVMPDESVDGQAVYVLQAVPKEAAGGAGKSLVYVAKNTGMVVKMVMYGPDGKPTSTTTYENVKLNADVPAEQFKFEVPEGVQVMDMTGQ